MRINGHWLVCPDDILRPVVSDQALGADGRWYDVAFLVDTGADATAFSVDLFTKLGLEPVTDPGVRVEGVGGAAASVVITTTVRIPTADGAYLSLPGRFSAFTEPGPLDLSYIGRNILNNLSVVVDRPGDVVCLLHGRHRYVIQEA